jgi:4-hydroxy-tetrahydrodipicolinate synthase
MALREQAHSAFFGVITALLTPFRGGAVDWDALDAHVDRQIAAGVDGVVPCGTTGESATLSHEEHDEVIERVIRRANGRCNVIAGTGSNSTAEAVRLTKHAEEAGADAALVVVPYYNRPTQEGMYRHFAAIAKATTLPIVLYNVPFRCGADLLNPAVMRLRGDFSNIVSLKDASGGVTRVSELVAKSDIDVLSGDDDLTLPLMAHGAVGVISVVSNLLPGEMKALVDAAGVGDFVRAREAHRRVCGFASEIGALGPNPLPIKTAVALKGWYAEEFRLPMCPMADPERVKLQEIMRRYEIL